MATSTNPECCDCKSKEAIVGLLCRKHFICNDCLVHRTVTVKQPNEVLKCVVCNPRPAPKNSKLVDPSYSFTDAVLKPALDTEASLNQKEEPSLLKVNSPDPSLPGIHIFVDDSNIWIAAKILLSKLKGYKTSEDHRVRIDMGKLADVLAAGRTVEQGILYGSEPPPIDTVWNKIRERGFTVKSERRHKVTGKEKQIDTNLVADVTATAIRTPPHQRTAIVLVTGDANVIPALEKVLEEDHWQIEVYMWDHAISKKLKRFAEEHRKKVEVTPLDKYLDKLAFTNMKVDISNRRLLQHVKAYGIVLTMKPKVFKNRIPSKKWINEVESIAQWPVQYYWFESRKRGSTDDLVIVFKRDPRAGEFDVTNFLSNILLSDDSSDQEYRLRFVLKVQTFQQYITNEFKETPDPELQKFDVALEQVGLLSPTDVNAGYENEAIYVSEEESKDSKWSTVVKRIRPKRQKYSDICPHGLRCRKGTQCDYQHSEADKAYFVQRKGGCGNPFRKTKLCKEYGDGKNNTCRKSKQECENAHGEEDAFCLACRHEGHFTDSCPNPL